MIDALLSDRPDDRRELFEEAAGVGLYRDRRRTTERRLEETTVDLQRLDDLITEVQSQVRSLARQRKRAERYSELTARRFTIEIALAKREMEAWHDELQRLDERVRELRESAPRAEEAVRAAEQARDTAHGNRAAAEAQRTELLRLVSTQREQVQQIRGEMAVAEERQRNATRASPARRARGQRRRGIRRARRDRSRAGGERSARSSRSSCRRARETLSRSASARKTRARQIVRPMRASLDDAERQHRELQDRARRVEIDRERARRESDELVAARRAARRRSARSSPTHCSAIERELEKRGVAVEEARARVANRGRSARGGARRRIARRATAKAIARAELFRADEVTHVAAGQGQRARRARARARRSRTGGGASAPRTRAVRRRRRARPVERFHQRRSRLRHCSSSVSSARRCTRCSCAIAQSPRQCARGTRRRTPARCFFFRSTRCARIAERRRCSPTRSRIASTPPARDATGFARCSATRSSVDDGAAFIDARGAVWLPGSTAGPGPLRRRAELFALRAELDGDRSRRARTRWRRGQRSAPPCRNRSVACSRRRRARGGAGRRASRRGAAGRARAAPPARRA